LIEASFGGALFVACGDSGKICNQLRPTVTKNATELLPDKNEITYNEYVILDIIVTKRWDTMAIYSLALL